MLQVSHLRQIFTIPIASTPQRAPHPLEERILLGGRNAILPGRLFHRLICRGRRRRLLLYLLRTSIYSRASIDRRCWIYSRSV
jgi:hypothetical protein